MIEDKDIGISIRFVQQWNPPLQEDDMHDWLLLIELMERFAQEAAKHQPSPSQDDAQ